MLPLGYTMSTGTPSAWSEKQRPFQNGMIQISSRVNALSVTSVFSMIAASFFLASSAMAFMPGVDVVGGAAERLVQRVQPLDADPAVGGNPDLALVLRRSTCP